MGREVEDGSGQAHPLHARATLIHEMLHALGLEYDAPGRTKEAVLRRCRE